MEDSVKKPIIFLLIPIAVIPAIVIVVIAFKVLFTGSEEALGPGARLQDKLAGPRIASVLRSEAQGAVAPRPAMASDAAGRLFVGWGRNIVDVRGRQPVLAAEDPGLSSFVATPEGLIMTVRGDRLGYVSSGAVLDKAALPAAGMRLERLADDKIGLFGPVSPKTWAVYMIAKGGTYSKLFTFPVEISAVTGVENGMLFASAGSIYRVEFGKRIVPVVYLPARPNVVSLAYDAKRRAVFFSTQDAIYLSLEGQVVKLLGNVSGTLNLRHDGLYILSDTRQELIRVDNIFKS